MEAILSKTIQLHHKDWEDRLPEALWAYRITWRNTTGHTPNELVYGKQVLLPIEFQVKTFRMAVQLGMDLEEAKKQWILQINELDEIRKDALQRTMLIQNQWTKWHDKFTKKKSFITEYWAFLFNWRYKNFKGKLTTHWMGPYDVVRAFDNGSVESETIDDSQTSFVVNGHRLRLYRKPMSK